MVLLRAQVAHPRVGESWHVFSSIRLRSRTKTRRFLPETLTLRGKKKHCFRALAPQVRCPVSWLSASDSVHVKMNSWLLKTVQLAPETSDLTLQDCHVICFSGFSGLKCHLCHFGSVPTSSSPSVIGPVVRNSGGSVRPECITSGKMVALIEGRDTGASSTSVASKHPLDVVETERFHVTTAPWVWSANSAGMFMYFRVDQFVPAIYLTWL